MREQPLHGRDAELAQLGRLADAARRDGEVRVALVGGDAGMGKSHLVDEAVRRLQEGPDPVTVLRGECLDLGAATLPYAPVVQALRPVLRDPGAIGVRLDEPTRAGLARLVPELGEASANPAPIQGQEVGHTQLFELLLGVVEHLADASGLLVLVVEDVHFGEQSTRDLLAFLVGNLAAVPLLLVLTARVGDVGRRHPARPLLRALERSPRTTAIPLGPLDQVAMNEIVAASLTGRCEQRRVDEIVDRADGNPFHAVELARHPDRLPAHLSDVLLEAVERCGDTAQAVLRALAAAGEGVTHDLLLQVTGLSSADLTAALREASDAGLIAIAADGTHRLRHALLQEAVEDSLLPGEARELHAAFARVLAADGGPRGHRAARLARHHLAARQPELALEAAYAAGVQALEVVAYGEARRHLELVAELWDEVPDAAARTGVDLPDVLVKAALSAISGHEDRRGIALAEQALERLDPATDPVRVGITWMWIGHGNRRDWAAAEAAFRRAVATVPDADSPERARVLAALATGLMLEGRMREAGSLAEQALAVARRTGSTRDEVSARITTATIRADLGDPDADAEFERARQLADAFGRVDYRLRCDINQSDSFVVRGRYAEAIALSESGYAIARAHGLGRTHGTMLRVNAVDALLALGRLDEACDLGREVAVTAPDGLLGALALRAHATARLRRGDVERAAELAASANRHMDTTTQPQLRLPMAQLRVEVALATGEPATGVQLALHALQAAAGTAGPEGLARYQAAVAAAGAEAALAAGSPAPTVLAALRAHADAAAEGGETAPHRAHRLLLHALTDPGAAPPAWDAAADAFADLAMPVERSRALLGGAEAALHLGDRAAAATRFKEALRLATDVGAERLRRRVEDLGRRGGFVADRPVQDGYGLTAREHEVLRLVAEGLSNPEIGERLFISAKTASVHVSHILAKLEVPTRQHAAALAHRAGLVG